MIYINRWTIAFSVDSVWFWLFDWIVHIWSAEWLG